jgi:Ca2+-binding RTX toxin-like protein
VPALVQKVIQSLTYRNDGEGGAGTRQITLVLDDPGLRETTVQFNVDLAASVPPEPNKPPTDIALQGSSVLELAANGTRIGDFSATDAAGSSFTFQILKADGTWGATDGRFTIEGSQLKVANGLLLDYEQAKSHTIKIKVTDGGGLSYEKEFAVTVGDVNPEMANGSAGSDSLVGGSGDDILNGMAGADVLVGGGGTDTYYVDDANDRVIETATGGVADEVCTTISYTLAAYVEHLTASGSAAISLTGNALSNRIKGNAAANKINGGNGDDTLAGGAGNDRLTGGKGKDMFVFDTAPAKSGNKDTITDWSAKYDTIQLENAVFKALKKTGGLSKSHFVKAAKALDGNDYIGYDATTGNLWYDHNGSKAGGQLVFANIGKHKSIAFNDFLVI